MGYHLSTHRNYRNQLLSDPRTWYSNGTIINLVRSKVPDECYEKFSVIKAVSAADEDERHIM